MLTLEQLNGVNVNTLIEMPGLMRGVDSEKKLLLKCTHAKKGVEYIFETKYMGIALGNVAMLINNGKVTVEDL